MAKDDLKMANRRLKVAKRRLKSNLVPYEITLLGDKTIVPSADIAPERSGNRHSSNPYGRTRSIVFACRFLGENTTNPSVFSRESTKKKIENLGLRVVGGNHPRVERGS